MPCSRAVPSQVGVPRKFVEHLVNIADEDRDGEINYHEFTRILTADDITKIKVEGAEEQGLVQKEAAVWWNQAKNITREDMQSAQSMMAERLMERGGILKMFRVMDEDKSGRLSRGEVRMMVGLLNLETIIRPAVLEELVDMMDVDGDGAILYKVRQCHALAQSPARSPKRVCSQLKPCRCCHCLHRSLHASSRPRTSSIWRTCRSWNNPSRWRRRCQSGRRHSWQSAPWGSSDEVRLGHQRSCDGVHVTSEGLGLRSDGLSSRVWHAITGRAGACENNKLTTLS